MSLTWASWPLGFVPLPSPVKGASSQQPPPFRAVLRLGDEGLKGLHISLAHNTKLCKDHQVNTIATLIVTQHSRKEHGNPESHARRNQISPFNSLPISFISST